METHLENNKLYIQSICPKDLPKFWEEECSGPIKIKCKIPPVWIELFNKNYQQFYEGLHHKTLWWIGKKIVAIPYALYHLAIEIPARLVFTVALTITIGCYCLFIDHDLGRSDWLDGFMNNFLHIQFKNIVLSFVLSFAYLYSLYDLRTAIRWIQGALLDKKRLPSIIQDFTLECLKKQTLNVYFSNGSILETNYISKFEKEECELLTDWMGPNWESNKNKLHHILKKSSRHYRDEIICMLYSTLQNNDIKIAALLDNMISFLKSEKSEIYSDITQRIVQFSHDPLSTRNSLWKMYLKKWDEFSENRQEIEKIFNDFSYSWDFHEKLFREKTEFIQIILNNFPNLILKMMGELHDIRPVTLFKAVHDEKDSEDEEEIEDIIYKYKVTEERLTKINEEIIDILYLHIPQKEINFEEKISPHLLKIFQNHGGAPLKPNDSLDPYGYKFFESSVLNTAEEYHFLFFELFNALEKRPQIALKLLTEENAKMIKTFLRCTKSFEFLIKRKIPKVIRNTIIVIALADNRHVYRLGFQRLFKALN